MKPTPKEIINEWFERVWKVREKSDIDTLMADDAIAHLAGGAQVCGIAQFSTFMTWSLVPFLVFQFVCSDRSAMTPRHACSGKFLPRIKTVFSELLRHIKELPSVARASLPSAMAKSPRGGIVGSPDRHAFISDDLKD